MRGDVPLLRLGCVALVLGSTGPLAAQPAVAAGVRTVVGAHDPGHVDGADAIPGLEVRSWYDGRTRRASWRWRTEVAYTQLRRPRQDALGRYTLNENGFDLHVGLRRAFRVATATGYTVAGPVHSIRAACGVDSNIDGNGRVPCPDRPTQRLGGLLGVGLRVTSGSTYEWLVEGRVLRGTVGAPTGTTFSFSVGLQRR